jgi:hypothetical protein
LRFDGGVPADIVTAALNLLGNGELECAMQKSMIALVLLLIAPTVASACPNYACRARMQYFENGTRILISMPGNVAPWSPAIIVR